MFRKCAQRDEAVRRFRVDRSWLAQHCAVGDVPLESKAAGETGVGQVLVIIRGELCYMNFEPQKFFIGLVDFFSIIMPGALSVYLILSYCPEESDCSEIMANPLLRNSFLLDSIGKWIAFLFGSYLLGHLIFLIGSILDGSIYDPFRNCTDHGQIKKLAKGHKLSWGIWRKWVSPRIVFGPYADTAVMKAERIKDQALQALSAEATINTFQWCKARLSIEHPEGLVAVQHFEADSKFFRSFCIVLVFLVLFFAWQRQVCAALICVVLFGPALWR
jgi:hypothetical protein